MAAPAPEKRYNGSTLPRGNEFWRPEKWLLGETIFLLAGGPSLRGFDCERLRGRHVMAINSSCLICPWAEFLVFTDNNWWQDHRKIVLSWPGRVFTYSRLAKSEAPDKLLRPEIGYAADFLIDRATVLFGRSTGHSAISLSAAMGARRIVLLGYDMRIVDGRSHHHDEYRTQDAKLFSADFLPAFKGWNKMAQRAHIEIVNATPGSALTEFPIVSIDDVLAEEPCSRS